MPRWIGDRSENDAMTAGCCVRSHFFITGTDTGVGKTTLAALLCAALDAVYWKPIQTGTLEGSDRVTVMRLAGIGTDRTLEEVYKFVPPVSPDLAARWAGVEIDLSRINLPTSLLNDWLDRGRSRRSAGADQSEAVYAGHDGEIHAAGDSGGAQWRGHHQSHAIDAWRRCTRRNCPCMAWC